MYGETLPYSGRMQNATTEYERDWSRQLTPQSVLDRLFRPHLAEEPHQERFAQQRDDTDHQYESVPDDVDVVRKDLPRRCIREEHLRDETDVEQRVDQHQDTGRDGWCVGSPFCTFDAVLQGVVPQHHLHGRQGHADHPEHCRVEHAARCVQVAQEDGPCDDVDAEDAERTDDVGAVLEHDCEPFEPQVHVGLDHTSLQADGHCSASVVFSVVRSELYKNDQSVLRLRWP